MSEISIGRGIWIWGWTLSLFVLISYLLCVAFGLLVPGRFHMVEAWAPLLPGFEWLTVEGFIAGAVGSFLYGWYAALLLVPLHHFFARRSARPDTSRDR